MGLPWSAGACHDTAALPSPGAAATPVGAAGGVGLAAIRTIDATEGTPFQLTMNSM